MLLGTLPAGGALVGARHGNAGVIRIGDGWTAVLTFGPDARRPAPGSGTDAASGIGAALAGLLAMGARPIAVLSGLRRAASHAEDPLVSTLVVGLVREDAIVPAAAPEPGDLVVLCGGSGGSGGNGARDAGLVTRRWGSSGPASRPAWPRSEQAASSAASPRPPVALGQGSASISTPSPAASPMLPPRRHCSPGLRRGCCSPFGPRVSARS